MSSSLQSLALRVRITADGSIQARVYQQAQPKDSIPTDRSQLHLGREAWSLPLADVAAVGGLFKASLTGRSEACKTLPNVLTCRGVVVNVLYLGYAAGSPSVDKTFDFILIFCILGHLTRI